MQLPFRVRSDQPIISHIKKEDWLLVLEEGGSEAVILKAFYLDIKIVSRLGLYDRRVCSPLMAPQCLLPRYTKYIMRPRISIERA